VTLIVAPHSPQELNRPILFIKTLVILLEAQAHGQLILMDIVELVMAISIQIISVLLTLVHSLGVITHLVPVLM
jgi:hypothetical protein